MTNSEDPRALVAKLREHWKVRNLTGQTFHLLEDAASALSSALDDLAFETKRADFHTADALKWHDQALKAEANFAALAKLNMRNAATIEREARRADKAEADLAALRAVIDAVQKAHAQAETRFDNGAPWDAATGDAMDNIGAILSSVPVGDTNHTNGSET